MRVVALALLAHAVACLWACSLVTSARYEVPSGPRELDEVTPRERRSYVQRAAVWQAVDTASLDVLAGPVGEGSFAFEEEVPCDFAPDEDEFGGTTPKFPCRLPSGEVLKVKYGRDNGEVYAEVAASRLFWALGFGTDAYYPVRVVCRGCPVDPWTLREAVPDAVRTFPLAVVERDQPGETIEVDEAAEGWAWWELDLVDQRLGGAPRAHVDALRLLAAFVQHTDNKDEQQRLVCLPGGVTRDTKDNERCTRPFLLIADLGATFSRADIANLNKMEFDNWSTVPVWREPEACVAQLKRSFTGTLRHPRIGEAGRRFLAERLTLLSDGQIRDLFVAARVAERGEYVGRGSGRRLVTADDWAEAFRRKRAEIVDHRCPA